MTTTDTQQISMRDFFKSQLKTMKLTHGILQLEKLLERGEEGKSELTQLLDILTAASEQEPYNNIPSIVKQRVIRQYMLRDQEFKGLNAALINRYLWKFWNEHGDKFLNEKSVPIDNSKLEPLSEITLKKIKEFQAELKAGMQHPRFENLGEDMKKIKHEDATRQEGRKPASSGYRAFSVPVEDANGVLIGHVENVFAISQGMANASVQKLHDSGQRIPIKFLKQETE